MSWGCPDTVWQLGGESGKVSSHCLEVRCQQRWFLLGSEGGPTPCPSLAAGASVNLCHPLACSRICKDSFKINFKSFNWSLGGFCKTQPKACPQEENMQPISPSQPSLRGHCVCKADSVPARPWCTHTRETQQGAGAVIKGWEIEVPLWTHILGLSRQNRNAGTGVNWHCFRKQCFRVPCKSQETFSSTIRGILSSLWHFPESHGLSLILSLELCHTQWQSREEPLFPPGTVSGPHLCKGQAVTHWRSWDVGAKVSELACFLALGFSSYLLFTEILGLQVNEAMGVE